MIERDKSGNIRWFTNGRLHREDGPAIEYMNGLKEWYCGGILHREDGPAREWIDGSRQWFANGRCHRADGPAVELFGGYKRWFFEGAEYTREEFERLRFRLSSRRLLSRDREEECGDRAPPLMAQEA
jgi:hypothetical protein